MARCKYHPLPGGAPAEAGPQPPGVLESAGPRSRLLLGLSTCVAHRAGQRWRGGGGERSQECGMPPPGAGKPGGHSFPLISPK